MNSNKWLALETASLQLGNNAEPARNRETERMLLDVTDTSVSKLAVTPLKEICLTKSRAITLSCRLRAAC